ncbi:hypothetical protein FRB96_001312 [Tulasnella sp. 330]|nr:hypothetical protein FRB96_001312 [Tulasnella sp. 330]
MRPVIQTSSVVFRRSFSISSSRPVASPDPVTSLQHTARARISAIDARLGKPGLKGSSTPLSPAASLSATEIGILRDIHQPQPLVDTFRRTHDYLRISLTEKCNLRCFYCMPKEGIELSPRSEILSDDEIIRLGSLFVRNGVKKIRLTGGEPTLRKGIVELIDKGRLSQLHSLGLQSIGITSNGLAMHRKLPQMIENGLTHLNLSLDTLSPQRFEQITRRKGYDAVLKTLNVALSSPDLRSVKLNTVIMKGVNDDEVLDFVEMARDVALIVRFIEFMPFSGNDWEKYKLVPSSELLARIAQRYPSMEKTKDELNDTARSYTIPGFKGSFGFISSMSDHFCGTCNRLRITADGKIKVCLFDGAEISLRDQMRGGASDQQLMNIIGYAVGNKKEKHDAMEDIDAVVNRPMILIGGLGARGWRRNQVTQGVMRSRSRYLRRHAPLFRSYDLGETHRSARMLFTTASSRADEGHVGPPAEKLTHIDASGHPAMVNVSHKAVTHRSATATGRIYLTANSFHLVCPNSDKNTHTSPSSSTSTSTSATSLQEPTTEKTLGKGPVLPTAQLAAILAAKQTSNLIPLCHSGMPLTHISVTFTPEPETFSVKCVVTVECDGKTGVEMEALVAVNGALLCVWDMIKAIAGREMRIADVCVMRKSGGKSGDWVREV